MWESTFRVYATCNVVDFGITSRIFAVLRAPADHLSNELLLCRLIRREGAEKGDQLASAARVGLGLAFVEDIEQEDAEIPTRATLASLQERLCAAKEDVGRGGPVLGFGVARCDHAELLVGFIVLAFSDSTCISWAERLLGRMCYLSFCRCIVFSILADMARILELERVVRSC